MSLHADLLLLGKEGIWGHEAKRTQNLVETAALEHPWRWCCQSKMIALITWGLPPTSCLVLQIHLDYRILGRCACLQPRLSHHSPQLCCPSYAERLRIALTAAVTAERGRKEFAFVGQQISWKPSGKITPSVPKPSQFRSYGRWIYSMCTEPI